jgi:hypothetical protein
LELAAYPDRILEVLAQIVMAGTNPKLNRAALSAPSSRCPLGVQRFPSVVHLRQHRRVQGVGATKLRIGLQDGERRSGEPVGGLGIDRSVRDEKRPLASIEEGARQL